MAKRINQDTQMPQQIEGKCNISQVKESSNISTKSSVQPETWIPTWSSEYVTGVMNEPVKFLQPLNKDLRYQRTRIELLMNVL